MQNLNIQNNTSLRAFNTFGIDVSAQHFMQLTHPAHLQQLLSDDQWRSTPMFILGGGSNILLTKDYPGLVVKNELSGITVTDENADHIDLKVGAGEIWHRFVIHCIKNHYGGVENLSLIPGTVGAAPMQNIGAYGVEISSVFISLEAIDLATGDVVSFSNNDCHFGYRSSIFKNSHKDRYIICNVTLRLTKKPILNTTYGIVQQTIANMGITTPNIKSISDAVISIRQSKLPDPNKIPNAGSFFKNPFISSDQLLKLQQEHPEMPFFPVDEKQSKIPAAWLIEQCGWKGKRIGNAGVHNRQALVLINHNHASGEDLKKLANAIQQSVIDEFNIKLIPEVNIID